MIHTIKIDSDVEERLKEFNAKLPADQKIVHLATSDGYLFVTTEKKDTKPDRYGMQILADHLKRGQVK